MTANFVPQRQRAIWHTTMLELVSTGVHTHPSHYLLSHSQARLLSIFGKACPVLVTINSLIYVFSTLEVPILPWTEARTTCPGPKCV
jgi:hypothetical protein